MEGGWGVLLASLILLSSLFHFADTESKTEDHSFVGFPAIWNLVAFYVFAFEMSEGVAAGVVLICVAFTFVPLKWAHPMRTRLLWPVTAVGMALWLLAAISTLWLGFPAGLWTKAILLLAAAYGIGLTVYGGWAR